MSPYTFIVNVYATDLGWLVIVGIFCYAIGYTTAVVFRP